MTTPVTPTTSSARPGRAPAQPGPASAAGFAAALHGVLTAGREPSARPGTPPRSERGEAAARAPHRAEATERARDERADPRASSHGPDHVTRRDPEARPERAHTAAEAATARAATGGAVDEGGEAASEATSTGADQVEEPGGPEVVPQPQDLPSLVPVPHVSGVPAASTPAAWASAASASQPPGAGPVGTVAGFIDGGVPILAIAAADLATAPTPDAATDFPNGLPASGTGGTIAPAPHAGPAGPALVTASVATAAPTEADAVLGAAVPPHAAPALTADTVAAIALSADTIAASVLPADTVAAGRAVPVAGSAPPGGAHPTLSTGGAAADPDAPTAQQGAGQAAADGGTSLVPPGPQSGPVAGTTPLPGAATVEGTGGADGRQPVGTQVARQVAVLRGAADGSHTMTVVLTPDTLGPVEVEVTVAKGVLDLTLRGAHEHGRAALLDALPDLRRDLEQAGLSLSRAEVDRGAGGSRFSEQSAQNTDRQQAFGDRGGHNRENRFRPWSGDADTGDSRPTQYQRTTSAGVDVLV